MLTWERNRSSRFLGPVEEQHSTHTSLSIYLILKVFHCLLFISAHLEHWQLKGNKSCGSVASSTVHNKTMSIVVNY